MANSLEEQMIPASIVVKIARKYASKHRWCDVVDEAIAEMGIIEPAFDQDIEVSFSFTFTFDFDHKSHIQDENIIAQKIAKVLAGKSEDELTEMLKEGIQEVYV